ncbi:hypothetical protein HOY82DRAFT_598073 [Tuber indicum]|nr:hypothetical protein HOY82DRAFT_598073 [Tuber indicum]
MSPIPTWKGANPSNPTTPPGYQCSDIVEPRHTNNNKEAVFQEWLSIINNDFPLYPTRSPCTYVGECMLMNRLFVTALISSPAYANPLSVIATVGIFSAIVIWQTDKVKSDIKDVEQRLANRIQGVEGRLEVVASMIQNFELKLTYYIQLVGQNIQRVDLKLNSGIHRVQQALEETMNGAVEGVGGEGQAVNGGMGDVSGSVASESGDSADVEAFPNPQND